MSPSIDLLDADDLALANMFQPAPGARLLSVCTILQRFQNICRHLGAIEQTKVDKEVVRSVERIVKHLSYVKRFYPSGTLEKAWLSNSTVALLRAAMWNVLGHERYPGAHSMLTLLLLQTVILLMDQCGA